MDYFINQYIFTKCFSLPSGASRTIYTAFMAVAVAYLLFALLFFFKGLIKGDANGSFIWMFFIPACMTAFSTFTSYYIALALFIIALVLSIVFCKRQLALDEFEKIGQTIDERKKLNEYADKSKLLKLRIKIIGSYAIHIIVIFSVYALIELFNR